MGRLGRLESVLYWFFESRAFFFADLSDIDPIIGGI
jgi:hypothetical protein